MAVVALCNGLYVRGVFANGGHAVMTSAADRGYTAVIKACTSPCRRTMTGIALLVGRDMLRWFTAGRKTIVAAIACADNRGMVDPTNATKSDGVMAVFT